MDSDGFTSVQARVAGSASPLDACDSDASNRHLVILADCQSEAGVCQPAVRAPQAGPAPLVPMLCSEADGLSVVAAH